MVEQIIETVGVSSSTLGYRVIKFEEVVAVNSSSTVTYNASTIDNLGVSDISTARTVHLTNEVLQVSTASAGRGTYVGIASNTVGVRDDVGAVYSVTTTETFSVSTFSDSHITSICIDACAIHSDSYTITNTLSIVEERLLAASTSKVTLKFSVDEVIGVSDSVGDSIKQVSSVAEFVGIRSSITTSGTYTTHVSDLFNIADAIIVKGIIRTSIRETLGASDSVNALLPRSLLPDFYKPDLANYVADVWTADARVWAMSRYVGVPVTEFVATSKLAIGAGRDGLYSRDTVAPTSWVQTGRASFDSPVRKRIAYVYTYGQHEDPLDVMVFAERGRDYGAYTYTQPTASPETQSAVRCAVGRALVGNNFMFRMGNSPFDLQYVQVEFVPTKRRIGG